MWREDGTKERLFYVRKEVENLLDRLQTEPYSRAVDDRSFLRRWRALWTTRLWLRDRRVLLCKMSFRVLLVNQMLSSLRGSKTFDTRHVICTWFMLLLRRGYFIRNQSDSQSARQFSAKSIQISGTRLTSISISISIKDCPLPFPVVDIIDTTQRFTDCADLGSFNNDI